jgi:hypothetical protein
LVVICSIAGAYAGHDEEYELDGFLFSLSQLEGDPALNDTEIIRTHTTSSERMTMGRFPAEPSVSDQKPDDQSIVTSFKDSTISNNSHSNSPMNLSRGSGSSQSSFPIVYMPRKTDLFRTDEQVYILQELLRNPNIGMTELFNQLRDTNTSRMSVVTVNSFKKSVTRYCSVQEWFHNVLWKNRNRTYEEISRAVRSHAYFVAGQPGSSPRQIRIWMMFCITPLKTGDLEACQRSVRRTVFKLSIRKKREYLELKIAQIRGETL